MGSNTNRRSNLFNPCVCRGMLLSSWNATIQEINRAERCTPTRLWAEAYGGRMICRTCIELESSLQTARQVVPPEILRGLTEAGERNRVQQKNEKVERLEGLLRKHRLTCQEIAVETPSE